MVEDPEVGFVYAVAALDDPLAAPLTPMLCVGGCDSVQFVFAPGLNGDGQHDPATLDLDFARATPVPRHRVLSKWSARDSALVAAARSVGLLPPAVHGDAGDLRATEAEGIALAGTPQGRLSVHLTDHEVWAGSNAYVYVSDLGFDRAVFVLRTDNPYQARSQLVMLGVNRDDIARLTGISG